MIYTDPIAIREAIILMGNLKSEIHIKQYSKKI